MTALHRPFQLGSSHQVSKCARSFHTTLRQLVAHHNLVRLRPPSKAALKTVTDLIREKDGIEVPLHTYSAGPSQPATSYLQFSSLQESLRFISQAKTGSLDVAEGPVEADTVSAKQPISAPTQVIYVKELPEEGNWDESSLRDYFSREFGPVTRVVISRHGHRIVQSAFIEFESMEDAAKVIKKQAEELFILSGMLLDLDYSHVNLAHLVAGKPVARSVHAMPGVPWDRFVHIRGLPKDMSQAKLTEILASRGFIPSAIHMCFEQSLNPGFVDIQLESAEEAAQLIQSFRKDPLEAPLPKGMTRYASAMQGQAIPPVYPRCRTICLPHMPAKVDEQRLFHLFSQLGTVQSIKVVQRPGQPPFTTVVYVYMARGPDAHNIVGTYMQTPLMFDGMLLHPQYPPPRVTLAVEDCKIRLDRYPGGYSQIVEWLGEHATDMQIDVEWKGWIPLPGVWSGRLFFPSREQAIAAREILQKQLKAWIVDKQKIRQQRYGSLQS